MNNSDLQKEIKLISDAKTNFFLFTSKIFARGVPGFIGGPFVEKCCNYFQKWDRTMRIAARSHFKSFSYYAYIESLIMYRGINEDLDIRYFSFNERMAGEHIQKVKALIRNNPYFDELIDLKSTAENVGLWTWDKKHFINLRPQGIISFARGMKANIILCDDILSDPANAIHPTTILKVNNIFRSVVLESIKPGGEIHVIGSPISRADLYYIPEIQKEFHTVFFPALIKDENENEVPQWPEFYTLKKIKDKISVMGEKVFAAEMMLEPYYSADAFFNKEQLRKDIVNPQLKNIRLIEGQNTHHLVVAGLDIGKKKHPATFQIFEVKDGKAIMIHHKVMKKWAYYTGEPFDPLKPSQVEYCKEAIKKFCIDKIYYDNTRGELEGASDMHYLTPHFVPVVFTHKMKVQLATDFEKAVLNKQLEIFDDEEMLNSICSVTNDLLSIESAIGHADCFWSVALALIGFNAFDASSKQDKGIAVGSPSIMDAEKPPKGW